MNKDQTNGQTTATAGTETATSAKHTCTVCGYKAEGTNFMVPKFEEIAEAAGVSMRDLTAEMVVAQAVCKRCVGQNGLWDKGYKFTLSSALAQLEKRTAERAAREAIEAERKAEAEARQAKIDAEQAEIAAKHQAWRKSALTCVVCKDLDDADHGATPDFGTMREKLDRVVKSARFGVLRCVCSSTRISLPRPRAARPSSRLFARLVRPSSGQTSVVRPRLWPNVSFGRRHRKMPARFLTG